MPDDLTTTELTRHLRSYGDWLEDRSDVTLARRPADLESGIPQPAPGVPGSSLDRPAPRRRLAAVAAAVVVLAGSAAVAVSTLDSGPGTVVTGPAGGSAGDAEQTEEGRAVLDVEGVEDQNGAPVPATDGAGGAGDGDGDGESAAAEPDTGSAATTGDGPGSADGEQAVAEGDRMAGGDQVGDAGAQPGNTDTTNTGGDGAQQGNPDAPEAPDTTPPSMADDQPAPDPGTTDDDRIDDGLGLTVIFPTDGSVVDLNLGTTVRVAGPADATGYRFVGSQDGVEVFDVSASEPRMVIPGALQALTAGWSLQSGPLTLTVTAEGSDPVSRTVTLLLRSGGGLPRVDRTIPTIPE
ncbi:MAG: hypothetical protein AAF547_02145 [Actinomycetota bacterium]